MYRRVFQMRTLNPIPRDMLAELEVIYCGKFVPLGRTSTGLYAYDVPQEELCPEQAHHLFRVVGKVSFPDKDISTEFRA